MIQFIYLILPKFCHLKKKSGWKEKILNENNKLFWDEIYQKNEPCMYADHNKNFPK